jgi:hypothetical protein
MRSRIITLTEMSISLADLTPRLACISSSGHDPVKREDLLAARPAPRYGLAARILLAEFAPPDTLQATSV